MPSEKANNLMTYENEARKRSVDKLQTLYTIVISLALTESLRSLLAEYPSTGEIAGYQNFLMFFSLVVTVIPIYHGANRYLDATYVTGERSATRAALIVDFLALFIEGLGLFALAIFSTDETLFYTGLAILLVFDVIWVGLTYLTTTSVSEDLTNHSVWALINIVAAILLLILVWSNLFVTLWSNEVSASIAFLTVTIGRTICDYYLSWDFYYPRGKST